MTIKERSMSKLEELNGYLTELEDIAGNINWERYQTELMVKRGIERTLQLIVETTIDLGNIILAAQKWRPPASNRDIFNILTEHQLLESELGQFMNRITGFRNLLVHDYGRVDDAVVYGLLSKGLPKFRNYYEVVLKWVKNLSN